MLSFKDLNEKKKTAVKINPNLKDVQEKKGEKNCGCGQNPCITYGDGRHKKDKEKSQVEGYQRNPERDTRSARQRRMDDPDTGINSAKFRAFMADQQSKPKKKKEVKEAKKKDDTYLETDFKKRLKNNEKARKDMMKGPQMKNPHFESNSYDSQEKISEKSTEESTENSILTFNNFHEATRLKKEKGYNKGGSDDKALNFVKTKIRKEYGKPAGQQKKVKGAKSDAGTGKYKKRADDKKAYAAKAKKAGFKSTQSYTDTMARYGGESNYKKGRGLGS